MCNLSKAKKLVFLVLSFVMLTIACSKIQSIPGTTSSKNNVISEKTKGLVQKLKDEDAKLSNKTLPTDISSINEECHKIFYSIISESDSTSLAPEDILEMNSNMYIKIGNNIKINNRNNRIIEFGKKNPDMGSYTKVYIQSSDDKSVSLKEVLTVNTNSNNIARVGPTGIYNFGGKYYAVVSDLMFDTDKDRDYVRLTIFALLNNSWQNVKVSDFEGYKDIFVDKGNTYNIDSTDKGLKILIVNNDEKVLDQIFVDFTGKTFIQN